MQTPQPPTFNNNYQWGQNTQNRSQTFRGFYVNDPSEIRPGDVPMDGSICFFPASNLSSITIKQSISRTLLAPARGLPICPAIPILV